MNQYRWPMPFVTDQSFPTFLPATWARAAADRYDARWGQPKADWRLRERANARPPGARLSPRERREVRNYLGPDPRMAAAVRFVRDHPRRARLLRRRRPELAAVVVTVVVWGVGL